MQGLSARSMEYNLIFIARFFPLVLSRTIEDNTIFSTVNTATTINISSHFQDSVMRSLLKGNVAYNGACQVPQPSHFSKSTWKIENNKIKLAFQIYFR